MQNLNSKVIGRGQFVSILLIPLIISLINGINKEIIVPNKTLQNLNLSEKTIYSITTFLITTFITTIISWGVTYSILAFRDNTQDKPNVFKASFAAFEHGRYLKTLKTSFLTGLFTGLWTILLIIPGIIKGYSYAMTPYIMKDMLTSKHDMKATEAITQSRKLMLGHKWQLFWLDISFLGWAIINILLFVFGIIFCLVLNVAPANLPIGIVLLILAVMELFWLTPYYRQTKANFYRQLAGNQFLEEK